MDRVSPIQDPRRIEVIDAPTAQMFRAMTPDQRVALGLGMHEFLTRTIAAGVRSAHPTWSNAQIHAEVITRMSRAAR